MFTLNSRPPQQQQKAICINLYFHTLNTSRVVFIPSDGQVQALEDHLPCKEMNKRAVQLAEECLGHKMVVEELVAQE